LHPTPSLLLVLLLLLLLLLVLLLCLHGAPAAVACGQQPRCQGSRRRRRCSTGMLHINHLRLCLRLLLALLLQLPYSQGSTQDLLQLLRVLKLPLFLRLLLLLRPPLLLLLLLLVVLTKLPLLRWLRLCGHCTT
jgi:hypothetical protein